MTRRTLAAVVVLSLAATLSPPRASGQDGDPEVDVGAEHRLELRTEKVVVFKDGFCLVVKRGAATTDENGEIHLEDVPDSAVLGSFWATPASGRLLTTTAGWVESEKTIERELPCADRIEVLEANVGRECTVELSDKSIHTGVIRRVLVRETSSTLGDPLRAAFGLPVVVAHPRRPRPDPHAAASAPVVSGISGQYFVLDTAEGDLLLSASDIRKLGIREMKTTITRTVTSTDRAKRMTFRFAEPDARRELLVVYFRPGVRWIPTYRIDLSGGRAGDGPRTAEIDLQAEIINEAEDLIDTPIDIVVGVPNFRFRTVASPLTLERVLRNTLVEAAPQLMGQFRNDFSNLLYTQRAGELHRAGAQPPAAEAGAGVELPEELTAEGRQDLFVYNLPRMTLRRGERTAVSIFRATSPYRDVYTWDLHVVRNNIAVAPSGSGVQSPLSISQNEVWRQIELTNTTDVPWTTGAAMIMDGHQPLAQELLTYTSPTDVCRVPVTVSVDARGTFEEREVRRDLRAIEWNRYHYARIRQEAMLGLCNHKSEAIQVEITLRFGGKADEVSHDGTVTLAPYSATDWENYRGDPVVNNSSRVRWTVDLDPEEVFEPTVVYDYYTRH